uniref:Uncharacterized protein n=1 Tax=Pipistrellus kuhlii TaxID=59472 RepID=A0A7J7YX24_PIPKU|nr:hypothetical protein mPipKuh1_009808 [Pipistrellus kuhlii]
MCQKQTTLFFFHLIHFSSHRGQSPLPPFRMNISIHLLRNSKGVSEPTRTLGPRLETARTPHSGRHPAHQPSEGTSLLQHNGHCYSRRPSPSPFSPFLREDRFSSTRRGVAMWELTARVPAQSGRRVSGSDKGLCPAPGAGVQLHHMQRQGRCQKHVLMLQGLKTNSHTHTHQGCSIYRPYAI